MTEIVYIAVRAIKLRKNTPSSEKYPTVRKILPPSEKFQNPIEKLKKQVKSIPLAHRMAHVLYR
jgi:hypothetical protein